MPLPLGLPQLQQLSHPVEDVPVVNRTRNRTAGWREGQVGGQGRRHRRRHRWRRRRRQRQRREVHRRSVRYVTLRHVEGSAVVMVPPVVSGTAVVVVMMVLGKPPLVSDHGLDVLKV